MNGYTVKYNAKTDEVLCAFCHRPTRVLQPKWVRGNWSMGGVVCDDCLVLTPTAEVLEVYEISVRIAVELETQTLNLLDDMQALREAAGYATVDIIDGIGMELVQIKHRLSIPQLVWSLLTSH